MVLEQWQDGADLSGVAGLAPWPACKVIKIGSCELHDCSSYNSGTESDAGPISLVGGQEMLQLSFNDAGSYSDQPLTQPAYAGGQAIGVHLLGSSANSVPTVSTSLVAPSEIQLQATGDQYAYIDRTKSVSFSWINGVPGDTTYACIDGGVDSPLCCTAPATAGELTIPAAVVSLVVPAGGSAGAVVVVGTQNEASQIAQGWKLSAQAKTHAVYADGADAQTPTLVQ